MATSLAESSGYSSRHIALNTSVKQTTTNGLAENCHCRMHYRWSMGAFLCREVQKKAPIHDQCLLNRHPPLFLNSIFTPEKDLLLARCICTTPGSDKIDFAGHVFLTDLVQLSFRMWLTHWTIAHRIDMSLSYYARAHSHQCMSIAQCFQYGCHWPCSVSGWPWEGHHNSHLQEEGNLLLIASW